MTVIADLQLTISPYTALYTSLVPDANISAYENTVEGRNAVVLDFNQGNGLYSRDFGTIFSWPTSARTILYTWQPTTIEQPEGIYGRATDWMDGGDPGKKFIQGVIVRANTFGVPKTFFLQDSGTLTLHPLNECPATYNNETSKAFSCVTPFTTHSARVISTDGVEWQLFDAELIFEPYPESAMLWQTEMTSLGLIGWGHIREINFPYVSTAPVTLTLTFDAWPAIPLNLPSTGGLQAKTKLTVPANKFKLVSFSASSSQAFTVFQEDVQVKLGVWGRTDAYTVLKPFGGKAATGAEV